MYYSAEKKGVRYMRQKGEGGGIILASITKHKVLQQVYSYFFPHDEVHFPLTPEHL
jgi:hypothetical protein